MAQRIKSVKQETLRQIYACHVVLVMTDRERTDGRTDRQTDHSQTSKSYNTRNSTPTNKS